MSRSASDPEDASLQIEASLRSHWLQSTQILHALLSKHHGSVSSQLLRRELEQHSIPNARELCVRMRFYDPNDDSGLPAPQHKFFHRGRSFYSEEAFNDLQNVTQQEVEKAESESEEGPESPEVGPPNRQPNRQEEARLCIYVKDALDALYASDYGPDDPEISFDVHAARAGSAYENVDVIAVHWRSDDVVELIAVEVKLEFTAELVQQAHNYCRFSNRVWIAVPITSDASDAGSELRETNPRLFEYVTSLGLGILGCRRRRGRSYDIFPLHWPRLCVPEPVERAEFLERHRGVFERARILEPKKHAVPRLR